MRDSVAQDFFYVVRHNVSSFLLFLSEGLTRLTVMFRLSRLAPVIKNTGVDPAINRST